MIKPPVFTESELSRQVAIASGNFRDERLSEPLEAYLIHFDECQGHVEDLLETSVDLTELDERAAEILQQPALLEACRYLAGPPLSKDDLQTLSEGQIQAAAIKSNPQLSKRVIEIIKTGLDRRRFPWVSDGREPTQEEKTAAVIASAALMATRRLETNRRNDGKRNQEDQVKEALRTTGFKEVAPRKIPNQSSAPQRGEFCGECLVGSRKADIVVRLWDQRVMAIECKVSNSEVNSIKRVNNDAAIKARTWTAEFGTVNVVPAAVLSGVYKPRHLFEAQSGGLTLFWAHDLAALTRWIEATR